MRQNDPEQVFEGDIFAQTTAIPQWRAVDQTLHTRLNSPNLPYPRVAFRLSCINLNLQIDFFVTFLSGKSRFP